MRLCHAPCVVLLGLATACAGTSTLDAKRLAALPPLPYRIALAGGAFLPATSRTEAIRPPERVAGIYHISNRTYPSGAVEPIEFAEVERLLTDGRAGIEILIPSLTDAEREKLASRDPAAIARVRVWAEAHGADVLLVIEGLREGPVELLGVTGQWPVTSVAWLLVGLGMFIPDHRFESKVKLMASVRDVHTGRVLLPNILIAPGPMELSLVERSSFFGILTSIVIPPTLVANDAGTVVETVRAEGDRRMLLGLLARLKDQETLETMRRGLPMRLQLAEDANRNLRVEIRSTQELAGVEVERIVDGRRDPETGARVDAFRSSLLRSAAQEAGGIVYRASLPGFAAGEQVRVVVQSIAGERVSTSLRLAR